MKLTWKNDRTGHWQGFLGTRQLFEIDCYRSGGWSRAALYRVGNDRRLGLLLTGRPITQTKAYAADLLPKILASEA